MASAWVALRFTGGSPLLYLYRTIQYNTIGLQAVFGESLLLFGCAGLRVECLRCLCGGGERRRLGGNAPEDHGSGLLNCFQALAQEIGVSAPKLDVVLGRGSVLKSDRLADHESHGFGLGLADLFGGQGAPVATMHHFVGDLMAKRGKLLGWLHP